ncbi:MAG: invasion associated locus B family protein [Azospirillum sp.]|nr:invasion associated locus B family protein [Azospirillum sp.]
MFEDWGIECETQADRRELCFAQQTHTQRESGQRIISVSVGYLGANNAPTLVVFTPLGVNVASGAAIRIDSQPQIAMPIQTCVPEGCRATVTLTAEQLRAFAAARTLTLGMVPWGSDQTSTVALSIRGLSAAVAHLRSGQ